MPTWLALVIVIDVAVTVALVFFFLRHRIRFDLKLDLGSGRTLDLRAMTSFARDRQQWIAEYMRANWSGHTEHLPVVLGGLLDELEREARSRDLALDRDALKLLVESTLMTSHVARGNQVREALRQIA